MIKQIAIQEVGRLQSIHRDLIQDIEMGKAKQFSCLRLWYIENRIKHLSKLLNKGDK